MGRPAVTELSSAIPARYELLARIVSGVVMGAIMIAGLIGGGMIFVAVIAFASVAALREWHRLVNAGRVAREMIASAIAVVAALFLFHALKELPLPIAVICAGALFAAVSARSRGTGIIWHAVGPLYVGLPALALTVMRDDPNRGVALVGGVFVAVWTADTAALLFGRLIGGPKLAPRLSPNKTWAGFLGGIAAAGVAVAAYAAVLGGMVLGGFVFGIILGLAGHCGDLFESRMKRQFHAKNSGHLIPGHGGMLDRIDSLLFAAPVGGLLAVLVGDPLFGALR